MSCLKTALIIFAKGSDNSPATYIFRQFITNSIRARCTFILQQLHSTFNLRCWNIIGGTTIAVTHCSSHLQMVSAFALSVAMNMPSGSWIHKGGGLGVDFVAFTVLNIFRESSVDVISDASVSALQQARCQSLWLICLKVWNLSLFAISYIFAVTSSFNLEPQGTLLGW